MDIRQYAVAGAESMITPALLFYKEQIIRNTEQVVKMAGDPARLWAHVKTHKTREITGILMAHGITKFKCSTIAEAEVVASCGASDIIFAYQPVGPNIKRFVQLIHAFPEVHFLAIADEMDIVCRLGEEAVSHGITIDLLVDTNTGLDRTGVSFANLDGFYREAAATEGIRVCGIHGYDGHLHIPDRKTRDEEVKKIMDAVHAAKEKLTADGYRFDLTVMGGTATFPCYAQYPDVSPSPGTVYVNDWSYYRDYKDIDCVPAAALLCRVVSRPTPCTFTIDLGHKAVAAERPVGERFVIVGMEEIARPIRQNEEHCVLEVAPENRDRIPAIGTELYVLPAHICPSVALYPFGHVAENGQVTGKWEIAARNRQLNI